MLVFTMKMILTDIQRSFHGFSIIIYMCLIGLIVMTPFYSDNYFTFFYIAIISFSALAPQITKIFYVLPFGSKLLRKYLHLRAIVLASFFLILGGAIILIVGIWHEPNIERGSLVYMIYIQLSILMSLPSMIAASKRNKIKNSKDMIFAILLLAVNIINAMFLINFKLQLLISFFIIIISEALIIIGLRKANLINYEETAIYGLYTKAWRNQQRMLVANSEKKV